MDKPLSILGFRPYRRLERVGQEGSAALAGEVPRSFRRRQGATCAKNTDQLQDLIAATPVQLELVQDS